MTTWNTQDRSNALRAFRFVKRYVRDSGLRQPPPILSTEILEAVSELLGNSSKEFLRRCLARPTYHYLNAAARGKVCVHCNYEFTIRASYCKSCSKVLTREKKTEYRLAAYRDACLQEFGRENVFSGKEGYKLASDGLYRKYSVSNANDVPGVREKLTRKLRLNGKQRAASGKVTCLKRYGVDHWTKVPGLMKRMADRMERDTGVRNVMHRADVKKTHETAMGKVDWAKAHQKTRYTMRSRFGVDNIWELTHYIQRCRKEKTGCTGPWSPQVQANYLTRTGFRHCMQNPKVFHRMAASSFKKHLPGSLHKIKGLSRSLQGWEPILVEALQTDSNVKEISVGKHVPRVSYKTSRGSHSYFPDLKIKTQSGKSFIVEVKSSWTLFGRESSWNRNYLKFRAGYRAFGSRFILATKHHDHWYFVSNPAMVMVDSSLAGVTSENFMDFLISHKNSKVYLPSNSKVITGS